MTVEPQPAGPTFARSARVHDVRTYIYIYIYIKNIYIYMTKIFPHCTISVGLAPLADYTALMQNRSCYMRKQTCNGEYTKHCTRSRHQLKMAAPAEVSEKRSNFRIRQFEGKRLFNIAANLTLNTMASFVILLIARTARIACSDRQTDRQTDTHETNTVTLSAHRAEG